MKYYSDTRNLHIQNAIQKVALAHNFKWAGKAPLEFIDFSQANKYGEHRQILYLETGLKIMTYSNKNYVESGSFGGFYKKLSISDMFLVARGRYFSRSNK